MSKTQGIWLCFLLLALLLLLCIAHHAPRIEADLSDRSRAVLDADNITWAAIAVDGRDLTLSGTAPSKALRQSAAELASAVWGVRRVTNELRVESTAAGSPSQPLATTRRKTGALRVLLKGDKS